MAPFWSSCLGPEWAPNACMLQHAIGPVVYGWRRLQVGHSNARAVVPWLYRTGVGLAWCGWECAIAALPVIQSIWIDLSPTQSRWMRNINYGILQHLWFQRVPTDPGQYSQFSIFYGACLSLICCVEVVRSALSCFSGGTDLHVSIYSWEGESSVSFSAVILDSLPWFTPWLRFSK